MCVSGGEWPAGIRAVVEPYQAGPGLGAVFLAGTGVVLSSVLGPWQFQCSSPYRVEIKPLNRTLNSFKISLAFQGYADIQTFPRDM